MSLSRRTVDRCTGALAFALFFASARGAAAADAPPAVSPPPEPPGPPPMPPPLPPPTNTPLPDVSHMRLKLSPPSPKRALPNYDGRGPTPSTVGEDLLWVPRIVFSPVYFTTEYVIRRPLGAAISAAERSNVPQVLYDFFVFGPDHKAGILPIVFFDFGFSPSVGLLGFWNDAGVKGHDVSAHFSIWTDDWIAATLGDSVRFAKNDTFSAKLAAIRRPDRTYFGEGPGTVQDDLSRYGETRLEGSGTFDIPLWRSSALEAGSGLRSVTVYHGSFAGDPSVEEVAGRGAFPLPYGFGRAYEDQFNHALVALDTRKPGGSKTGVRLEAQVEQGSDVKRTDSAWIRYQGTAGVFYDLNGRGRVVSLAGTALFADPLVNGGAIPFTELVSLGGNAPVLSALASGAGLMPGLYSGRLVDRSAAVATLQYRWPIWAFLDGVLQADAGNAFGDHLDKFKLSLLRFSGALGIETSGASNNAIHLLVGIGSETFDHGGQVDSFRLVFGTSRF